ncbi:acyl-CoA dehydrogenase family protein [Halomarina oriensis]|uniref:Acyl-CoA dehydrogenase n=1 Tax=Halomarina oriensis TaxID=671145 RepID=A0A6B0GLD8_9EURY|nr:acyl-CoA dehydrogenase family protein [Halomarina oriensis]MWG33593.1 acyl-CoA dehydrogenase [Halomarina oriensis]
MEYDDSQTARDLRDRAREFMDEEVIPTEREYLGDGPVPSSVIEDLRAEARERDVFCPQIHEEWGGGGYEFRDVLPLFEEAGRSLLGASAMRVDAPDEGNMHTIELVGTDEQKGEYLKPLVAGDINSAFSMTEPRDGAGSDPKMLKTTAEKEGDEWVINGHKWWTTQGSEADVFIVMAKTDQEAHPYAGCSLFLVDADADGVTVERDIPHLGPSLVHATHAEITYDDVRVPESALLGVENEGFAHAQQRLGPARLTHCMRFTGMATRALTVAKAYMSEREAFDSSLADKQSQRFNVAEYETELHAVRTMVRHAAAQITAGEEARVPVSMCKVFAANTTQETIDFAVQACGGNGIGRDLPLADFYEAVRAFRIVDGADEVHKRVIARDAFEEVSDPSIDNTPTF